MILVNNYIGQLQYVILRKEFKVFNFNLFYSYDLGNDFRSLVVHAIQQ